MDERVGGSRWPILDGRSSDCGNACRPQRPPLRPPRSASACPLLCMWPSAHGQPVPDRGTGPDGQIASGVPWPDVRKLLEVGEI